MASKIYLPNGSAVEANLFDENFVGETNAPWSLTLANAATLAMSTAAGDGYVGGNAMKFTSGTSASSEIHKYVSAPYGASVLGMEMIFSVMDENAANVAFYTSYRDGTNWIRGKILHVFSTNVWSYQDSAGTQQPLMTRDTSENTAVQRWHKLLTVISMNDNTYKAVTIDNQDFTTQVNGQALRNAADATAPFLCDFAVEFTNTATPSVLNIGAVRAFAV